MLPDDVTQRVYDFICDHQEKRKLPPTYKKIASECKISMSAVRRSLDILEARGKIYREFDEKPAIRIVQNGNGKHHESF